MIAGYSEDEILIENFEESTTQSPGLGWVVLIG